MAVKEKDYAAIARSKMYRPADPERRKRPPRFLIYSRNKKGKTHFGNSAGTDHTLILDPEYGTKEMQVQNPHVWPIEVWRDMDDVYEFARHINKCQICPDQHAFRWLSIDGMTKISNLSVTHVMKVQEERSLDRIPGMVSKPDYGKAGQLVRDMLTKFHNLPQGLVFTAQERMEEVESGEDDEDVETQDVRFVPDLPKGARGAANAIVDVVGRLYVVRVERDDGTTRPQRRLWIGDSARYDTGYRSDHVLPDFVRNPTIPKMVHLMRTGNLPARKKAA